MSVESVGTKMLTLGLECLGSGAGGNVSLRCQVTFTVRRSAEVLLLPPKRKCKSSKTSFIGCVSVGSGRGGRGGEADGSRSVREPVSHHRWAKARRVSLRRPRAEDFLTTSLSGKSSECATFNRSIPSSSQQQTDGTEDTCEGTSRGPAGNHESRVFGH